MNTIIGTVIDLRGAVRVVPGTHQFIVWDEIQNKWMLGQSPFMPDQRFTHLIWLPTIEEIGRPE